MADTFGLEIYASNKLAFAGRAKTLTIPAVDGEQAFLAQHENIVAAIIPGEMRFEEADGTKHILAVSSGFVEMINNRVKLFCLTAESPEEIDIRRAQEAKEMCIRDRYRHLLYRHQMISSEYRQDSIL